MIISTVAKNICSTFIVACLFLFVFFLIKKLKRAFNVILPILMYDSYIYPREINIDNKYVSIFAPIGRFIYDCIQWGK